MNNHVLGRQRGAALRRAFMMAAVGATMAAALGPGRAVAQDFNRYRPLEPPATEGKATLPEAPAPAKGSDDVLVQEWKGIVFVPRRELVVPQPKAEGVVIEGESGLELLRSWQFQQLASKYLGGPITMRQLNELARDVILFYRRADQPVVDVSFPEQDLASGVVQVVVTEARVGRVRVEGARYFDPCVLQRQVCVTAGQRIYESMLMEDLRWLNRNPFREVDLTLEPGAEFGTTDVVFNVYDRRPVRAYAGYEDTGTRETDIERLIFGVNWGNALWRDHQLAYQYTSSPDFRTLQAHSGIYEIPLHNRDILLVYGAYGTAESFADPFDLEGRSWQGSFRYHWNFARWRGWERHVAFGFDFKQTNNNLDFGGSSVFLTNADIAQLAVGYHTNRADEGRAIAFGIDMYINLPEFSSGDNRADYETIRALAAPDYVYARMYLEGQQELSNGWSLFGRFTGQISDRNLLPSETLGFGGFNSIRGYDMWFRAGDGGYIVNTELRTPAIRPGLLGARDKLQGLVFWDIGQAWAHTEVQPTDPDGLLLSGVGPGFRYEFSRYGFIRCDYGIQLHRIHPDATGGSRVHVAAVVSY